MVLCPILLPVTDRTLPTTYLEFVHLPSYVRSAKGVIGDDEQRALEQMLVDDPTAGAVVAGTGGVRKIRVALQGRGRRGGARVIYVYRAAKGRVYLLLAYAKNQQATITAAEKRIMRQLTAQLEAEP
ncbi:MAG: type II toxin-antitoxin system RelE/ParE family toxin, partial [Candidatus Eremiobacteraeota bacterium]|nr:type II toxin-antitoxin system RelE/ParE family toxin [Candidatus Eremiobacteraeota bacterium]